MPSLLFFRRIRAFEPNKHMHMHMLKLKLKKKDPKHP
jgi:hypothetical protein